MHELDGDFLDELLEGDEEFAKELFEAFEDSVRRFSEQARRAVVVQDLDSAKHAFHTLKGSAGSVGLLKVREMAKAFEIQAKSGGPVIGMEKMDEFESLVRSGLEKLSDYRQSM